MFEFGSAAVSLRVEVLRNGGVYALLHPSAAPEVQMRAESTLKMSMKGEFHWPDKEISWLTDRIRPILTINGTDYPVGLYIGTTPRRRGNSAQKQIVLEAYSVLYMAERVVMEPDYIIRAGTNYIGAVQDLLQLAGIGMYVSDPTDKRITTDRADWPVGTTVLEVVNELLGEINYRDAWVDLDGIVHLSNKKGGEDQVLNTSARIVVSAGWVSAIVESLEDDGSSVKAKVLDLTDDGTTVTVRVREEAVPDTTGRPDHIYAAGKYSIISDDVDVTTDYFDKANVFRVVCSSPDLPEPLVAEVENDDPDSPFSTATLGVRIVETEEVDAVADFAELQEMAAQMRYRALQTTERIEFVTALDPTHGSYDTIGLDAGGESGIYTETGWRMVLDAYGEMRHTAERIVFI